MSAKQAKRLRRFQRDMSRSLPELFAKVAPPIFAKVFRPDCCLNATRVAIEVMEAFNQPVHAIATHVRVMNANMWKRAQVHGLPENEEEARRWTTEGAWSLAINGEVPEGRDGYPWHVVAISDGWLIDGSSGQFNRPNRDIHVDPIHSIYFQAAAPKFTDLVDPDPLPVRNERGTVIIYRTQPGEAMFKTLDGFQRSPWNLKVANDVVKAMRAVVGPNLLKP